MGGELVESELLLKAGVGSRPRFTGCCFGAIYLKVASGARYRTKGLKVFSSLLSHDFQDWATERVLTACFFDCLHVAKTKKKGSHLTFKAPTFLGAAEKDFSLFSLLFFLLQSLHQWRCPERLK